MLHLCSNISPALKAKIYHCILKLASLHVSNQQGNCKFRKLSLQGSCFLSWASAAHPENNLALPEHASPFGELACHGPTCISLTCWGGEGQKLLPGWVFQPTMDTRGAGAHPNPNPATVLLRALEMWPELHLIHQ